MKSERRHELKQNELADQLAKVLIAVKPYQNVILLGVLVVVVLIAAYAWWARQTNAESALAWNTLYEAEARAGQDETALDTLEDLAGNYADREVGQQAAAVLADMLRQRGCARLFENYQSAKDDLTKSLELYQAAEATENELLKQRVLFGQAVVNEALGKKDELEEAMAGYQEVADRWPDTTYGKKAAERLRDLEKPSTQRWYLNRFAHYNPRPPIFDDSQLPGSGSSLENIPSRPERSLFEMPGSQFTPDAGDGGDSSVVFPGGALDPGSPGTSESSGGAESSEPPAADAPSTDPTDDAPEESQP